MPSGNKNKNNKKTVKPNPKPLTRAQIIKPGGKKKKRKEKKKRKKKASKSNFYRLYFKLP